MPQAGWEIRDRSDAAPGIRRFVEQITMFLTLVGLTALGVGGVGAGQAIAAFLDRKRADIAILKSLGAGGGFVFLTFFLQVMAVALAATVIGALVGSAIPFAVVWYYGDALPVPPHFALYPKPLLLAGAFGLLSAVVFAVPPLSRARAIPPASLFRDGVAPARVPGRWAYLLVSGVAAALITALTLRISASPVFAGEFLAGAAASLILLRLLAEGLRRLIRALGKPRSPLIRLAFANLVRPGAATSGVITALGAGAHLARHRHASERHHRRPGTRRPARPRPGFLLCRYPARPGRGLRPHRHRLQVGHRLQAYPDDPWTDRWR